MCVLLEISYLYSIKQPQMCSQVIMTGLPKKILSELFSVLYCVPQLRKTQADTMVFCNISNIPTKVVKFPNSSCHQVGRNTQQFSTVYAKDDSVVQCNNNSNTETIHAP